jgi:plastocyanin
MPTSRLLLATLAGMAALLAAPAALAENQSVTMTPDDEYSPKLVAVKPGETVTWTNPVGEHNVVWNDNAVPPQPPESVEPSLWPAGGVSRTFDKPGKYRYYCQLHGDRESDFGMTGYVYVNSVGLLPPAVTGLTASGTTSKAKLKFRSSRAGRAKATFFRKSGRRFLRSGATTFSAHKGLTTKSVTRAFAKGRWRVDIVVTDSNRLASDKRTKTFTVG